MWQRTVLRVVIGLALLVVLLPRFFTQFHAGSKETLIIAGIVFVIVGAASFVTKPKVARKLEPVWGYEIREPYRTGVQALIILVGVGILVWAIKL